MKLTWAEPAVESGVLTSAPASAIYRRSDKVAIGYFTYTALMLSVYGQPAWRLAVVWSIPLALLAVLFLEVRYSAPWTRVTRDWAALGLILIAYRQVDWFPDNAAFHHSQQTWVVWDRGLLDHLEGRAIVESLGGLLPAVLEAVYLGLYLIPVLCMAALYQKCRRDQIDRFLTTVFLATFCAYALLPHFPSLSPRVAFPAQDLPHYASLWRSINVWLLDHCDISMSVFPSGHVAVAFSSAFGIRQAVPHRRWLFFSLLLIATLVFIATIYGRYHYAVDGLASIAISVLAWLLVKVVDRHV